ncbi:helix-turn-helix domain-containing protein [bacterium]|nr:helix-turn-helix domain-containing protein [bacterium]
MKNTGSFNEYILKDLKTDEDIKEWINIGFEEFLQDNDLNAFVKALEYAVRAKDSILGMSKKTGISRSNLYAIFNGEQQPQLSTALKIIKELGYTLKVA